MLKCPNCDQKRKSGSGLRWHLIIDHGVPSDEAYDVVGAAMQSMMSRCRHCGDEVETGESICVECWAEKNGY